MKLISIIFVAALIATTDAQDNYKSKVWSPDNGDGTFTKWVMKEE